MKIKSDLVLKMDGTHEVLLPQEKTVVRNEHRQRRSRFLRFFASISIVLILTMLILVGWRNLRRNRIHDHRLHYMLNGQKIDDLLQFDEDQETVSWNWCGTTDLMTDYNSFVMQVPEFEDGKPICIVYDQFGEKHQVPSYIPDNDMVENGLREMENETVEVQVEDGMWEPDGLITDSELWKIPTSIVRKCRGMKMFWMKEISDRVKRDEHDDEEEESPEAVAQAEEPQEYPQPVRGVLPPPHLRVDQGESDHGKSCCQHCRRPHLVCRKICVPLETTVYPYYYHNCEQTCAAIFPCSYWRLRANGQV